jgi:hypothetical protein
MPNTLPLQDILELAFNALTAAVGIVVIILGLRITSTLSLSTHRRALWISFGAVALIVASNLATVWANFSRISTFKDVGGAVAELVAVCSVGWAVRLLNRAEKEEVSSLRREAKADRPGQSIVLPPSGPTADGALREKRSAAGLRHTRCG